MNWKLFGLNPNFKEFLEKYPNKTILGVAWSLQWRLLLLILLVEIVFVILFSALGIIFGVIL